MIPFLVLDPHPTLLFLLEGAVWGDGINSIDEFLVWGLALLPG